jgi:hypothetical protein
MDNEPHKKNFHFIGAFDFQMALAPLVNFYIQLEYFRFQIHGKVNCQQ